MLTIYWEDGFDFGTHEDKNPVLLTLSDGGHTPKAPENPIPWTQ